jgi:hypothetical protein
MDKKERNQGTGDRARAKQRSRQRDMSAERMTPRLRGCAPRQIDADKPDAPDRRPRMSAADT